MTGLRLKPSSWRDLDRISEHFYSNEVDDVEACMAELLDALQLLALHPLIGRPVSGCLREMMIGRGSRGYVALYGYDEARNEVVVNAVRGQREAGFSGG